MINVVHGFSGVDAQYMAEKRVWNQNDINIVATMEIDVDAIITAGFIHYNEEMNRLIKNEWKDNLYDKARIILKQKNIGYDFKTNRSSIDRMTKNRLKMLFYADVLTRNLGDISLIDKIPANSDIDIFTYSFPCTNISLSGRQEGFKKGSGTSSSLLWECEKIIENNKPKVLLMENVKSLINKKNKPLFKEWVKVLKDLGYNSYYKVINAKNYGIPQNRERVFMVSIRNDVTNKEFIFEENYKEVQPINTILETNVNKKHYLSEKVINRFHFVECTGNSDIKIIGTTAPSFRTIGQRDVCYDVTGIMGCISATDFKQPKQIVRLNTDGSYDLRKMTPREIWRLMDFDDKYFDRIDNIVSDSQLYKQAGNSIVVACLEDIFLGIKKQLFS